MGRNMIPEFELEMRKLPEILPLVDLRNNVFFPETVSPINVGRPHARQLFRDLVGEQHPFVIIVAQRKASDALPDESELYRVGTLAMVLQMRNVDNVPAYVMVRGLTRVRIDEFVSREPYHTVRYTAMPFEIGDAKDANLAYRTEQIQQKWIRYAEMINRTSADDIASIFDLNGAAKPRVPDSNSELIGAIMMLLPLDIELKQQVLETDPHVERLRLVEEHLDRAIFVQEIGNEIHERTKENLEKQQREFILQQQIRTIQSELGEDPEERDVAKFMEIAQQLKCPDEARAAFVREVNRLSRLNPMSPDYAVQLAYLQLFTELPWGTYSKDNHNLARAQKILDQDHLGMDQVKERILEFLAVLKLRKEIKSPIICLHGPPGVGKTSLGKSIARALGRKYVRMALGGVDDEAEIRGHRRTYVGALPGRILLSLRKAKTSNPVLILDEVDKLAASRAGDPSAALLEVLDPEQNSTFHDNYLEVEYDLSHVLFVATANDVNAIPPALRDRMEMIEISGYLQEEKVGIATKHLIPSLLKEHGLKKNQFSLPAPLIASIVSSYTRESGVRQLKQMLAKLMRHQARHVVLENPYRKTLTHQDIRERLGIPRFTQESADESTEAGVAVGMAWTQVGGEILYVETSIAEGKGTLATTGNLGDVMRESATIALQYVRAQAEGLGISPQRFDSSHVHVHVPEGAIPKDGPSAGVTMVTSIASAFLDKPPRADVAMTGEITLRGKVLPVGGIKEKILAAKRANIHTILLPDGNRKDLEDINPEYIAGLEFIHVSTVNEVLGYMIR